MKKSVKIYSMVSPESDVKLSVAFLFFLEYILRKCVTHIQ